MSKEHIIGIDLGTYTIKIVIADPSQLTSKKKPRIIHSLEYPSHGFRNGYVVDQGRAFESFKSAMKKAELEYKQPITRARFSISGIGLKSQYVRTSIEITKKNNEIDEAHTEEVTQKAEELFASKYPNKKILHAIPVQYRVDDKDVLGTPIGMYGTRLEIKIIFITIPEHHLDALVSLIEKNNIAITDVLAGPLADAAAILSYQQKNQGSVIINIGSETTSFSTFKNGIITSLEILPLGSNDITNDLALGLQIPLEKAESIKKGAHHDLPKKKVEDIIYARIADILELADEHLLQMNKHRLFPAGILFTGGGSYTKDLNEYTRQMMKLPSEEIKITQASQKNKKSTRIPNQFSSAYGLCNDEKSSYRGSQRSFSLKKIKTFFSKIFRQLMP